MTYKARKYYSDREVARKYDRERFHNIKGYLIDRRERTLIDKSIKQAGIAPPAKLLDLPCGTGRLALFLARKGFQVEGVDISREMIEQAAAKLSNSSYKNKVKLNVGDAESLSFEDNYFDLVISLRLFGHLPPLVREKVLNELRRTSKSFVIIVYSHRNCLQGFLRKKKRLMKKTSWYPVSLGEIEVELKSANLQRVKIFPMFLGISESLVVLARKQVT